MDSDFIPKPALTVRGQATATSDPSSPQATAKDTLDDADKPAHPMGDRTDVMKKITVSPTRATRAIDDTTDSPPLERKSILIYSKLPTTTSKGTEAVTERNPDISERTSEDSAIVSSRHEHTP